MYITNGKWVNARNAKLQGLLRKRWSSTVIGKPLQFAELYLLYADKNGRACLNHYGVNPQIAAWCYYPASLRGAQWEETVILKSELDISVLWAKSEPRQSLLGHMLTVGAVCKAFLTHSVFQSSSLLLAKMMNTPQEAAAFASYVASLHDIGKCHPTMQQKGPLIGQEELFRPYPAEENSPFRHEKYSAQIIERIGRFSPKTNRMIGQVLSQHHQGKSGWGKLDSQWDKTVIWQKMQEQLEIVMYQVFCPPLLSLEDCHRDAVCTTLLGITILSDWIASGPYFADMDISNEDPSSFCSAAEQRAREFIAKSGLTDSGLPACDSFTATWPQILPDTMRPIQNTVEVLFSDGKKKPLALIIEAPMGEGKTEAGVFAALRLAKLWGKRGFYIGLPTAATSNQMHSRIDEMMKAHNLPATSLLHAMAWLLDDAAEENQIQTEDEESARSWTRSSRRGLLAPYSVGTIDQAMMAALQVKYGVLRLLGLESKVLILDEVHAYDTYMSSIIARLLSWCRVLRIPVVMLSATLPADKKKALLEVYGNNVEIKSAYPAVTAVYDGTPAEIIAIPDTYQKYTVKTVTVGLLGDNSAIAQEALRRTEGGGCLCVLMNTVGDAQAVYKSLKESNPEDCELLLFHARFSAARRAELESKCIELFGKDKSKRPSRAILVATQVVEQSLDLDFDRLITAIAPVDLLLQRMGRLHRHRETNRPSTMMRAVMEILVPSKKVGTHPFGANERVYPPVLLTRTWELLSETSVIRVPEDISQLVERVYSFTTMSEDDLTKWAEYAFEAELAKGQALVVEMPEPKPRTFSLGKADLIFDDNDSSSYLSAKTRLGESSVRLALVPETVYRQLKTAQFISRELAKTVLAHSTSVPERWLTPFWNGADSAGCPLIKGSGLLCGTVICAAENGICDFGAVGSMCMDSEIGFYIEKGDSQ